MSKPSAHMSKPSSASRPAPKPSAVKASIHGMTVDGEVAKHAYLATMLQDIDRTIQQLSKDTDALLKRLS